jgi:polyhydroxybutyrate depolymerase
MKRFIATLVLSHIAASVYGQGQALNKSLVHDGIPRHYTIFVPSSYSPDVDAPLVVNMHGLTLNRSFQMTASGMNAVAEQEGFLVAYPDAVGGDWSGPQDNIGFIDLLIDDVSSQYSVDSSKVYATGFSQGGAMSYILSVAMPDRFAAIASVSGPRVVAAGDVLFPPDVPTTPDRPFPLLHIHGTGDPIVPYSGGSGFMGVQFPPAEQIVAEYVRNNGGDATPTIVDLPNTNTTDGTTVQKWTYDGGTYLDSAGNSREAEVLLYRIAGGGHNWPGDSTAWPGWASPVNFDISASTEIWDFFSRHEVAAIPNSAPLVGDYDGSGVVEQADLDLALLNWGQPATPAPAAWVNDLPMGTIDQAELDGVLLHWGQMAAMGPAAAVPEPSAAYMVLLVVAPALIGSLNRRPRS